MQEKPGGQKQKASGCHSTMWRAWAPPGISPGSFGSRADLLPGPPAPVSGGRVAPPALVLVTSLAQHTSFFKALWGPRDPRGWNSPLNLIPALAGVAQWTANHRVTGSSLSQGTCSGFNPGPQIGAHERQPHIEGPLPLFLPAFPSL